MQSLMDIQSLQVLVHIVQVKWSCQAAPVNKAA